MGQKSQQPAGSGSIRVTVLNILKTFDGWGVTFFTILHYQQKIVLILSTWVLNNIFVMIMLLKRIT